MFAFNYGSCHVRGQNLMQDRLILVGPVESSKISNIHIQILDPQTFLLLRLKKLKAHEMPVKFKESLLIE